MIVALGLCRSSFPHVIADGVTCIWSGLRGGGSLIRCLWWSYPPAEILRLEDGRTACRVPGPDERRLSSHMFLPAVVRPVSARCAVGGALGGGSLRRLAAPWPCTHADQRETALRTRKDTTSSDRFKIAKHRG